MKGDCPGKPGCFYHPLFTILNVSSGILYKKTNTINKPHFCLPVFAKIN